MKTFKPVHLLVATNLLVFVVIGGNYLVNARRNSVQESAMRQKIIDDYGGALVRMDAMSKDDFARILDTHDSIVKTGRMDDAYLDWCLELMERPVTSVQARKYVDMRKMTAMDNWEYWKEVTPEQKDKVFRLASKYLTTPDGQFDSAANQANGASMVSKTKDTRAIPLLMPLTQSRYSSVQPIAKGVLKKLQRLAKQP